jgi:cell division protein FtsN
MYCKKCGLEIQGGEETRCPLCAMPLEESTAELQGEAPDESAEDLKLKELISHIEGTVRESLDTREKIAEPKEAAFQFDLEGALTEESSITAGISPAAAPAGAIAGASDYEQTRAAMEQALADSEQEPPQLKNAPARSATKNTAALLLVIVVIAAGIAAGYFFSVKEPQTQPPVVPVNTIAPQTPVKASPPAIAMAKPATPQTQKQEMPAAAESKPATPPVPISEEPAKDQAVVSEKVEPPEQGPMPPADEAAKTARDQQPEAATAPPSAQIPVAVQKGIEPPKQKTVEQPKTTKASVAVFYCVNVGSFKLKDSTDRVCRDLKKKGYAPDVEIVTLSNGSTWYRVTVGSFATRDEAAQFGKVLEEKTNLKPVVAKKK